MRTLRRRTAAIGAAVAIVGTAVAVPALAQSDTSDETSGDAAALDQHQAHHAERKAAFAEALAAELDLPVDEVVAALDAVHEDLHAARAEAADAIRDASDAGVLVDDLVELARGARPAAPGAGVVRVDEAARRAVERLRGVAGERPLAVPRCGSAPCL